LLYIVGWNKKKLHQLLFMEILLFNGFVLLLFLFGLHVTGIATISRLYFAIVDSLAPYYNGLLVGMFLMIILTVMTNYVLRVALEKILRGVFSD